MRHFEGHKTTNSVKQYQQQQSSAALMAEKRSLVERCPFQHQQVIVRNALLRADFLPWMEMYMEGCVLFFFLKNTEFEVVTRFRLKLFLAGNDKSTT